MDKRIEKMMAHLEKVTQEGLFFERVTLLEEARQMYKHLEPGEMYANAFAYVLDNMTVEIRDGESITGTMKQIVPDQDQEHWYESNTEDYNIKLTPDFSFEPMHLYQFTDNDDKYAPAWFCSFGHNVGDYGKVIRLGFDGILKESKEKLQDKSLTDKQIRFLNNSIVVCEAMIRLGKRYCDCAMEMARVADSEEERIRFQAIADTCKISPAYPAQTFRQALQTMWFAHMVECCVVGCRDYSFGRVDEFLYPYYKKDLDNNMISREEAKVLLQDFYIHCNELIGYVCENVDAKRVLCANSIQYFVLGGTDEEGNDITNDISYLAVEAMNELKMVKTPDLLIRWHENIDPDYWRFVIATCAEGRGYPSFFNETVIQKVLLHQGVQPKDANKMAFYGCNNICIAGMEDELYEVWHNGVKYLELALNGGVCPQTKKQLGVKTKDTTELNSLEDILEAYRAQTAYFLRKGREEIWKNNQKWVAMHPFSYESVIATNCIERAEPLMEGGSDYKHYNNHFVGIATVADSLEAIRQLVFVKKSYTLEGLLEVLKNNWKGNEQLQAYIKNKIPKYGNACREVDDLANQIGKIFIEEVEKLKDLPNGRKAVPTIYSLLHHRGMGLDVGATPDGRNAFTPLSENVSGTYGLELNGPTGILTSAARLPLDQTASGGQNIKFQKFVMSGSEGAERLEALIEAYFSMGGTQLQINVVDPKELIEAQKTPEKYKHLMVRVFGFTDYFISLDPDQQKEIIERDTLRA